MKSKGLVYVVLKLFAIFLIAEGINCFRDGILFWSVYLALKTPYIDMGSTSVMIPQSLFLFRFFFAAFFFGMAHYIWMFTPKIVKYIFPTDLEIQEDKKRQIKVKNLHTAAFSVMGIVILFQAIKSLSNWIEFVIMKKTEIQVRQVAMNIYNFTSQLSDEVHFLTIIGILIHIIIGIALIVWGKQFSKFIGKINPGAVTLAQRLQLLQKDKKPGIKNSEEIEQGNVK
jgi:hypothetical protein